MIFSSQIRCNMDIAYEGMARDYRLGIGRVIKEYYPENVVTRMKYYTAAASEARIGGCDMPVVINSEMEIRESLLLCRLSYMQEKKIFVRKNYIVLWHFKYFDNLSEGVYR